MSIEDIILSYDTRGISRLRRKLPKDFCKQAAEYILETDGPVVIITGFHVKDSWETDGPPGAAAIGIALEKIGRNVTYVTDGPADMLKDLTKSANSQVIEFPIKDHKASKIFADKLIADIKPSLAISIERCGMTREEKLYLNMRGEDISKHTAKIDYVFEGVERTVAIGDGGNEIGMGLLYDSIPTISTLVADPATMDADRLIIASVSNWGGYGLVAYLSILQGQNLLLSVDDEFDLVKKWIDLGGVDGVSGEKTYTVDNTTAEQTKAILKRIHNAISDTGAK